MFNEFKGTFYNKKKKSDIRREEFKAKTQNRNTRIQQIPLSVFDNKGFVLNDGIHMLAYFHKDLKNNR